MAGPRPGPARARVAADPARRVAHPGAIGGQLDRRFFLTLAEGIVGFVAIAAILITLVEKPWTIE